MDSLVGLARQLQSVSDLGQLVKTLKVLAAVNLRTLAKTSEALDAYLHNVEDGLQVALRELPEFDLGGGNTDASLKIVVFGSDHGLCGPFHHQLLQAMPDSHREIGLLCVGTRVAEAAQDSGLRVDGVLSAPTSAAALAESAQALLQKLQPLGGPVQLLYQRTENAVFRPCQESLWPIEPEWLKQLRQRDWPAPGLPMCWGPPQPALDWLLEEHLQLACQRALAHSLASENQARLLTMQAAEKNLEEMRLGLQDGLRSRRQNAVTEELLDVISGFEMLNESLPRGV